MADSASNPPVRSSALESGYRVGKSGILDARGNAGVTLQEIRDLTLGQVAAWPDTLDIVAKQVARAVAVPAAPGPCRAAQNADSALIRVEPLKWWVLAAPLPELDPAQGAILDLSHSRTRIRISGVNAVDFLNRLLPLDLRESAFPEQAAASSFIHHVGVTLWRSEQGYEMFVPRGFALSLWQGFVEIAGQFGLEVL